ncbi:MAG TPA: hypothetical protein VMT45_12925 [Thermoanaerobaculaceae bacterium]|nr:hypothetical protein [Thermoanaerobaculaceae bacterium]
MTASRRPATAAQQAFLVGAVFFVVYLLTRTRDLGGDDTVFAMAVDGFLSGGGPSREVFHPHHLAFNPLIAALCWLARSVGLHPFVADAGAALAALAAAAVVGGLVVVLRRAGVREGPALLGAAVAGVSGGLWQYATRMEVYALAAAAVLLWLSIVGRDRPAPVPAGASLAACLLAHIAAGLLVIPTAIRMRRRILALVQTLMVGLGLAAVVLCATLVLAHHAYTPRQWLEVASPGHNAAYLRPPRPGALLSTFLGLTVWDWYGTVPVFSAATVRWLNIAGAVAFGLLALMLIAGVRATVRDRHPLAVTAALALAAYIPLWLVWDTGNPEHAVAATPLFAALIAFGAATLPRRIGEVGLTSALALLLVVNGLASAVPQSRPENSRNWVIASFVSTSLPKDALLLSVGVEPTLRLSLPYLSGHRVVTLTLDVNSALRQGRPPLDGFSYWLHAGSSARSVWVTPDVLDPSSVPWIEQLGIPGGNWVRFTSAIRPGERRVLPPDGIVIREPFALTQITLAE